MDELKTRKQIRMKDFDYTTASSYFITICAAGRRNIFWNDACDGSLTTVGQIAEQEIRNLSGRFQLTGVDKYVIMPDHLHLIITLYGAMPGSTEKPPNIKDVVGSLKARITHRAGDPGKVWQKRFYEHVIRGERDYNEIWNYIELNPLKYISQQ